MPTATTMQYSPAVSVASSASSSSSTSRSPDGLPFPRNMSDFEVEHSPAKTMSPKLRRRRQSSDYDSEAAFRASVARLVSAKARPFCAAGRIPVDPTSLILFFRSKVSTSHIVRHIPLIHPSAEWHRALARFPHRPRVRYAAILGSAYRCMQATFPVRPRGFLRTRVALLSPTPPPHRNPRDRKSSYIGSRPKYFIPCATHRTLPDGSS